MSNYLENKILKLRAVEPDDLELLYEWENDTVIWKESNTLKPYSKFILKEYIKNSHVDLYQVKQLRLMIVLKNKEKTIGTIDIFDFDPVNMRAGVGILIGVKGERKKSYAKNALEILINYCFKILNLHQLYCNINPHNTASIRLFQGVGFQKSGLKKDWRNIEGKFEDELFLQLINN